MREDGYRCGSQAASVVRCEALPFGWPLANCRDLTRRACSIPTASLGSAPSEVCSRPEPDTSRLALPFLPFGRPGRPRSQVGLRRFWNRVTGSGRLQQRPVRVALTVSRAWADVARNSLNHIASQSSCRPACASSAGTGAGSAATTPSRAGIQGLEPRSCACPRGDIPAACRGRTSLGVLPSRVFTARTLPRISPLAPLSLLAEPRRPMPEPQGLDGSFAATVLASARPPCGRPAGRVAVTPSWGSCPRASPTARPLSEESER
jgi:hypothetical protein